MSVGTCPLDAHVCKYKLLSLDLLPHPAPTALSDQNSHVQIISDQDLILILSFFLAVLVLRCSARSSLVVVHGLSCPKAHGILVL